MIKEIYAKKLEKEAKIFFDKKSLDFSRIFGLVYGIIERHGCILGSK
ncbi:MAG: hypothetical protein IJT01_06995 [Selenomonadaceae bacterium]|nr:hypothetical protein [Selenomonadaceae bacterium]